jgi:putative spermidine/putrescine transport system permease protein
MTTATGTDPRTSHGARMQRWGRASSAWTRSWPMVPILVFLLAAFAYPVVQLLWLSLFSKTGTPTLEHYQRLFTVPVYFTVLRNTFEIAGWTTLLCIIGGYPIAYFLATTTDNARNRLILWVLLPFWTSFLVRTFAWIVLLGRRGAINSVLESVGLTEAPFALLFNMTGVMIGMVHALMPLAVLTMLPVMETIDRNLMPAASTLGARRGQAFWRIYLPLSLPGVAAAGLLVFITSLGFFITPAFLGSPRQTMITQVVIQQVEEMLNYPFAAAIAMLLLATALFVFYLYDRALGMTTLAGGGTQSQGGVDERGPVARAFGAVGAILTAMLGRATDGIAILWEMLTRASAQRAPAVSGRLVLRLAVALLLIFLAAPSFFIVPVSFTTDAFIEWPPRWGTLKWYAAIVDHPTWITAITRSLMVGTLTATLAMCLGAPAAFFLARTRFFGKTAAMGFILAPLILPRIIIAVALFYFYARLGLIGSPVGLVLGHTVLALPYVVITVMAVLKNYDQRLDQAATSLGASPPRVLWHITGPLIRSGLIAAFLFAFVTSFDELTIALFISAGVATTLPKQMWDDAILKVSPTLAAVSTLLLLFVTIVILAAEYFQRRVAKRN